MDDALAASFDGVEMPEAATERVIARPALSGARRAQSAFAERYLRRGIEAGLEVKSFEGTSDAAGGYAIPEEIDAVIDRTLTAISPIRGIANVVKVGSAGYRKLVTTGGTPSGWVSEVAARPETDTPDFIEIAPPMGELYANPAASQAMLDDAAFDVEQWLAGEIATEFARAEGAAFVSGNGTNKPRGFLSGTITNEADGVRAFGTIQYLASGAAGAFPASNPQDRLIDLIQTLRSPYRQGAGFVMNSATLSAIRKFKTSDGAFLWQPGLLEGRPDTLLGYPVTEAEDMPDVGANAYAIAFGNFRAGYLIAERSETGILRDPYSHKPFVHFYATKRIGGQVSNSEAIKLLKFSAA
ncbi:MAG: phage major capsid protein [Sphingomonadaceae bacterium]|nr:phage major capsid protein [Sphingomonadaceae bacterium]